MYKKDVIQGQATFAKKDVTQWEGKSTSMPPDQKK
jgi:hypothetical protein